MTHLRKWIHQASRGFNAVASVTIIFMVLLTGADVVLRFFGRPIPGTYELIGFLGSLVVSFSLAYTSVEKGHVSVDLLVERLPERVQLFVDGMGALLGAGLFGLVAWQSALYALEMKQSGEVSMTLQMPVYPFLLGLAAGCAMLFLALILDMLRSFRRIYGQ
jgi:TRAP-type C4-dicarboxylate transport system permease small subunit